MSWSDALSVVATILAVGSGWIGFRAYRIADVQALPPLADWGTATKNGLRSVEFKIEWPPDRQRWVVSAAHIRRNWGRRKVLAKGDLIGFSEDPWGNPVNHYQAQTPWERCITFDPPVREGVVMLHQDARDCEVTLTIVLSTSPSPTIRRHIKSRGFR